MLLVTKLLIFPPLLFNIIYIDHVTDTILPILDNTKLSGEKRVGGNENTPFSTCRPVDRFPGLPSPDEKDEDEYDE
jgi:hypothetical protein